MDKEIEVTFRPDSRAVDRDKTEERPGREEGPVTQLPAEQLEEEFRHGGTDFVTSHRLFLLPNERDKLAVLYANQPSHRREPNDTCNRGREKLSGATRPARSRRYPFGPSNRERATRVFCVALCIMRILCEHGPRRIARQTSFRPKR